MADGANIYQQPTKLAADVALLSSTYFVFWDQSDPTRKTNKIAGDQLKTLLQVSGGAGVSDGDKGDITVSASGSTWTIDASAVTTTKIANSAVTLAKLANSGAASVLLGRGSAAGAGVYQELTLGSGLTLTGTVLSSSGGAGVSDGDKGDITVSASGATWTIDSGAVSYSKIQNVSATDRLLGRATAGAGVIEEITCTSFGRSLLAAVDDAAARVALGFGSTAATTYGLDILDSVDAAEARGTLGLGTLSTLNAVGTAQITDGNVTLAKISNSTAASVLLGRGAGVAGTYQELTLGTNLSMSGTTLNATGGGGTPGGSNTQIQFNNSGAFGGSANLTWNGTGVAIASGTLTGSSSPAISVTQTWNNAATVFTGALVNITDTTSNASSLLLDLQTGGTRRARARKDGYGFPVHLSTSGTIQVNSGNLNDLRDFSARVLYGQSINLGSGVSPDIGIERDGANTLALRNAANPNDFRVYNTYTSSTNNEYLDVGWTSNVAEIGTVKGSGGGAARALRLKTDNVERVHISAAGVVTIPNVANTVFTITDDPSVDINPANGGIQVWTLTANRTPIAPTAFNAGQSVTLMIADGTSAYAVTWSSVGVVWVGGVTPTLPTTGYAIIVLWKVASTIYGLKTGDVA